MSPRHSHLVRQSVRLLAGALILKIVLVTFLSYQDYMPPNFRAEFLEGRGTYFWQGYHRAFYPHIVGGPLSLLLGLLLISERFRSRFRGWHRHLGKLQVANVLLVVKPG